MLLRKPASISIFAVVTIALLIYFATLGAHHAFQPTVVRMRASAQPTFGKYFGIDDKSLAIEEIAVVEATFTKHTRLHLVMAIVDHGVVTIAKSQILTLSAGSLQEPLWARKVITIAVAKQKCADGICFSMGFMGVLASRGTEFITDCCLPAEFSKTVTGPLQFGRDSIAYVAGDREITVDQHMALSEFAELNQGRYVAITIRHE